jgi:hypothetical protein
MDSRYFDPITRKLYPSLSSIHKSVNIIHHKTLLLLSQHRVLQRIATIDVRGIYETNISKREEKRDELKGHLPHRRRPDSDERVFLSLGIDPGVKLPSPVPK